VLVGLLGDHTDLFRQFNDNPNFKKWLVGTTFTMTYMTPNAKA
jgi:type I restriction enzyme R subunit